MHAFQVFELTFYLRHQIIVYGNLMALFFYCESHTIGFSFVGQVASILLRASCSLQYAGSAGLVLIFIFCFQSK